jgi:hypothetical protein
MEINKHLNIKILKLIYLIHQAFFGIIHFVYKQISTHVFVTMPSRQVLIFDIYVLSGFHKNIH